jgi:hypothetical protein
MEAESGETRLEALDLEIEREEAALAELRRRTRALEVEVAAWPPPTAIRGPRQIAADRTRTLEEAFLGVVGGWLLAAIVSMFLTRGHL